MTAPATTRNTFWRSVHEHAFAYTLSHVLVLAGSLFGGWAWGHARGFLQGKEQERPIAYEEGLEAGLEPMLNSYEGHLSGMRLASASYKEFRDPEQLQITVKGFLASLEAWQEVTDAFKALCNHQITELKAEMAKEQPDWAKVRILVMTIERSFPDKRQAALQKFRQLQKASRSSDGKLITERPSSRSPNE